MTSHDHPAPNVMPSYMATWDPRAYDTPTAAAYGIISAINEGRRTLARRFPAYAVGADPVLVTASGAVRNMLCHPDAHDVMGRTFHLAPDPMGAYGASRYITWSWTDETPDVNGYKIIMTAVGDNVTAITGRVPLARPGDAPAVRAHMVLASLSAVAIWATQLREVFACTEVNDLVEVTAEKTLLAAADDPAVWAVVRDIAPGVGADLDDWAHHIRASIEFTHDTVKYDGYAQHMGNLRVSLPALVPWTPDGDNPPPSLTSSMLLGVGADGSP